MMQEPFCQITNQEKRRTSNSTSAPFPRLHSPCLTQPNAHSHHRSTGERQPTQASMSDDGRGGGGGAPRGQGPPDIEGTCVWGGGDEGAGLGLGVFRARGSPRSIASDLLPRIHCASPMAGMTTIKVDNLKVRKNGVIDAFRSTHRMHALTPYPHNPPTPAVRLHLRGAPRGLPRVSTTTLRYIACVCVRSCLWSKGLALFLYPSVYIERSMSMSAGSNSLLARCPLLPASFFSLTQSIDLYIYCDGEKRRREKLAVGE